MTIKQKALDWFIISARICGEYCEKEYLYYDRDEAIALFKADFADLYEIEVDNASDVFEDGVA